MSTLGLKRRRDIWRQKWQFVAVLVTVVLGVAMFTGTFNAYLNLGASLYGTYERLHMADVMVADSDDDFAATAASIDGIETVVERNQAELPMAIDEFSFIGRAIGYPTDDTATLNQLDVDEGARLDDSDPTGVLVEAHAASDFALEVDDTFEILGQEVTVRGIVTSPEYLWPARDRQSVFTPPKSFAVVFVLETLLEGQDAESITSEVLIRYADDADIDQVDADVTTAATEANASDIQLLVDQPSNATIDLEIQALQTMAVALPLLFLAAAGMAMGGLRPVVAQY